MAQRRSRLVAVVVVVLLTGLVAAVLVYSGVRQSRVVVDAEPTGRVVAEGLFGANHRYPFDAFGSFTPDREPQQRLVASARSVGMSMLGPDEHMALVEQMGAETTMVVNFATATPQEAAPRCSPRGAANGRNAHLDPRSRHGRVRAADQGRAGWAGVSDRVENDDDDNFAPDTGEKGVNLTASLALSDRVHTAPHAGPHDVRASGATKLNSRPPTLRIRNRGRHWPTVTPPTQSRLSRSTSWFHTMASRPSPFSSTSPSRRIRTNTSWSG